MKAGIPESLKGLLPLLRKYKPVLLVLAVGLLLLLWPGGEEAQETATGGVGEDVTFDLEALEDRMEKVLSRIEGAGEVSLILTVKGGVEHIYAVDSIYSGDEDAWEERLETVLLPGGSGVETAAEIQQLYPAFQGALVVCDGGDDPTVRLLITQAVAALTGLGTDNITVCG